MSTDVKAADARMMAARTFLRSLNILLKFARLYGFDHGRTTEQFQAAWNDLRAAMSADGAAGLLLGAAGSQLLLDGAPMENTPAESSFAQLLSAAGLVSVAFSPQIIQNDLACFVRAFASTGTKPAALAEQLKTALAGASGIRINEVRFVTEEVSFTEAKEAAQATVRRLGAGAEQVKAWLNDPQKLRQLIAAAEGSKAAAPPEADPSAAVGPVAFETPEDEMIGALRLLAQLGQSEPASFQQHLSLLPERAQVALRQALSSLPEQAPGDQPNEPMLLRLAEQMATRFALDRYQRGEVTAEAVRPLLDRLSQEIESLRKALGSVALPSQTDLLDRQFWSAMPESGRQSMLLSPEAWRIPSPSVRQYVEELLGRGETETAQNILLQYASGVMNEETEARRKAASGLAELAPLYGGSDDSALPEAIRQLGAQLSIEREADLQNLISAAFVRLAQEATKQRRYRAVLQAIESLDGVENQRPAFAQSMGPRIGLENRLGEFIEEAVRADHTPEGLADILRMMPRPAMNQLTNRFSRCSYRRDCERLVELSRELGPDGVSFLSEQLRAGLPAEAAETVGLLSRLDEDAVEQWLPARLHDWHRSAQDRTVRQLAGCGAPERGRLLLRLLDELDPLLRPLALDEIGMSGESAAVPHLVQLVEREASGVSAVYVRLKAFEALGRLRARAAIPLLRRIAETRQVWRWVYPSELRIAALQALEKLDPAWTRGFVPQSGLSEADLSPALAPLDLAADSPWFRQRRYRRIGLPHPLAAATMNLSEDCRLEIRTLSLSGGLATLDKHLVPCTVMSLKLGTGLRPIRAQVIIRDARARGLGFEFLEMDLEDRAKLRRLLATELASSPAT